MFRRLIQPGQNISISLKVVAGVNAGEKFGDLAAPSWWDLGVAVGSIIRVPQVRTWKNFRRSGLFDFRHFEGRGSKIRIRDPGAQIT